MTDRTPLATLELLTSRTVRALPRGRRGVVPSCVHLPGLDVRTRRPLPAVACVQHPDRVRCGDCNADHVAGHTWDAEHRCDHCDGHDPAPWGYATFRRVKVSNLAGEVLRWPIVVGGFGLCQPCQAVAAREGWR